MRRPVGVALLAIFVAWQSFGLLSIAVAFAGPHTDLPLRPLPTVLGLSAAVTGFVLAHRLWRLRASAVRLLIAWAVLALSFAAFWPTVASPGDERRGAIAAVAMAMVVATAAVAAAARYLRAVIPARR